MRKTKKELFKNLMPMPIDSPKFETSASFPIKYLDKVLLGVYPVNMEDRWIVYEENDCITIHRSWSNVCIAKLWFNKKRDEFEVFEIQINGNEDQFKSGGKESDVDLILGDFKKIFGLPS